MRADIVALSEYEIPFLVRYAGAFPRGSSLGTETLTKIADESRDADDDIEMRPESSAHSWLASSGAAYDSDQGIWIKGGRPFVHDAASALGTSSHTNVRREEIDEDPD